MSCGVGHRHSLDLALLWRRLAATALIQPLAWEPPCASDAALKKKGPKKKKKVKGMQGTVTKSNTLVIRGPEEDREWDGARAISEEINGLVCTKND